MESIDEKDLKPNELAELDSFNQKMSSFGYENEGTTASTQWHSSKEYEKKDNTFVLSEIFSFTVVDNQEYFKRTNDAEIPIGDTRNESRYVYSHMFYFTIPETVIDPDEDGTFANIEIGNQMVEFLKENLSNYKIDGEPLHQSFIALIPIYTDIGSYSGRYFEKLEPHLNDKDLDTAITQMINKFFN